MWVVVVVGFGDLVSCECKVGRELEYSTCLFLSFSVPYFKRVPVTVFKSE